MPAKRWLRAAAALALAGATLTAGCGEAERPPTPKPITLAAPTAPTSAECGLTGRGSPSDSENAPQPGTYLYRTSGKRVYLGVEKRVARLPSTTKMIVTDSLRDGAQSCFTIQRAYEKDLGDTGTFVINGHDTYLRSGRFQAGGDITSFTPRPSPLIVSGSELEWSGVFRGQAVGRYRSTVIGRKRIRVDGKSVQAVGVSSRVEYSGDIQGSERTTRWFSLSRGLVLHESETLEREFGLDELRLSYKSRLVSLDPQ